MTTSIHSILWIGLAQDADREAATVEFSCSMKGERAFCSYASVEEDGGRVLLLTHGRGCWLATTHGGFFLPRWSHITVSHQRDIPVLLWLACHQLTLHSPQSIKTAMPDTEPQHQVCSTVARISFHWLVFVASHFLTLVLSKNNSETECERWRWASCKSHSCRQIYSSAAHMRYLSIYF